MSKSVPNQNASLVHVTDAEIVDTSPAVPMTRTAELMQAFGGQSAISFCSFDSTTPEGMFLLDKCEEAPDKQLREMANLEFNMTGFYMHFVDLPGKSEGETVQAVRTCLISDEGEVYACCAEGIRKSVIRLVKQHGLPPWKGKVPVVVHLKSIGEGRNWLTVTNKPLALNGKKGKS